MIEIDTEVIGNIPTPNGTQQNVLYQTQKPLEEVHVNTVSSGNSFQDALNADHQESRPQAAETIKEDQSIKEKLLLASICIEDALYGRTLPYKTDYASLLHYKIYSSSIRQWVTMFFMWFNLCLALFEYPAVPGWELPNWATMLMELLCLGVFLGRIWRLTRFVPRDSFIHDPKNIVILLTIVVTIVDMIVYIAMINSSASGSAIRVSRILRPLFLVNMNESRQIRRAFRNIRNTVPDILSVLVLFFFSIALFSLMAFKLFENRNLNYRTGQAYFVNYWDSYFDLYVLVTTANSPDVMMPAYDYSPWFVPFFIIYVIVNTYIFMNLILAVIYNSYRNHLQGEMRSAITEKRKKLNKAFDLLHDESPNEEEHITFETWKNILKQISTNMREAKTMLLWHVLCDSENESGISRKKFSVAADALNVRLVVDATDKNVFAKHCYRCYNSRLSKILIICVNHRIFVYFFDVLILANAVCIALNLEKTEWFFLPIFMIEIGLRIYAVGPREYFSLDHLWNWFDFVIISAAFIATIIEASLDELTEFPREALDVLLVLRCLRLVKIVGNIESFRAVVMTIVNIAPSLLTYGGVLLMVYYCFAIIGMEAFAGKLSFNPNNPQDCNNSYLNGSEFSRMGYCNISFNDILHSLVTLFVLMVVNQWHVITEGYVLMTSKGARVFFIFFHLTVVILILNIIVAFVLEAFILEYTIKQNKIEELIENKINELRLGTTNNVSQSHHDRTELTSATDADDEIPYVGRRQSLNKKQGNPEYKFRVNKGHKNIEVLLQRMFELEINGEVENESEETSNYTVEETTQSSSTI